MVSESIIDRILTIKSAKWNRVCQWFRIRWILWRLSHHTDFGNWHWGQGASCIASSAAKMFKFYENSYFFTQVTCVRKQSLFVLILNTHRHISFSSDRHVRERMITRSLMWWSHWCRAINGKSIIMSRDTFWEFPESWWILGMVWTWILSLYERWRSPSIWTTEALPCLMFSVRKWSNGISWASDSWNITWMNIFRIDLIWMSIRQSWLQFANIQGCVWLWYF